MKRICYIVSALLVIAWVSIVFVFHIGSVSHALILLAAIICLTGIIHTAPEKISGEAE